MAELKDLNLLYVEDEEFMQKAITKITSKSIGSLTIADNGMDGLDKYNESKPDIILTDLEMPVMNGLELIKEIRKNDKDTPIIIITAFRDQADFAEGADFVLIKPVLKENLIELLNKSAAKV
ncbi:response regulator [Limisalsivibrio acetivorans]|uniref:response regulator n=1 Tax=Limisalsivibrio acetivorans TaxID=1304888 RepID=UPI0003B7B759|nr:response regulator [Limisalsivibrio acetivorans]